MSVKTRNSVRGDARRRAFIKVAAELFLEKGFGATSVNEIVRRAGGSLATLYAYFHTKEELFESIINEISDHMLAPLVDVARDDKPVEEILKEIGIRFVRVLSHRKAVALYRIMVSEAPRFPQLRETFLKNGLGAAQCALSAYLRTKTEQGFLDTPDPDLAASQFFALLKAPWHLQAACGALERLPAKERDRVVASAVDIFMTYYGRSHA